MRIKNKRTTFLVVLFRYSLLFCITSTNFIQNGFLYHITPSSNVHNIMQKGLQTINNRCGDDIYLQSLKVNNKTT